ncbi:DMT family transporter [Hydrogenobacter sp. T-2]|uniref:DMT family transporter n=1 Tax=Pampinifervens diazotrophicum TaxID=1632018 RepID=UPI002B25DE30|nr:DMT family transporter [Hydrogenobacter sp. T-2]WPM32593.1 DMT family transporter [Hydrogenobacter sp. T-2]
MLGLSLALLSSIFWGTNDYLSKRLLLRGLDENFTLWVRFPIAFLLLTPLGILYWDFNIKVLTYALIWLPLEVLGGVLFIKGLKYAPLSVAMSFYSFMPVFSALFGWLILSEEPSPMGMLGMSLVILATLILVGFSPKEFFKKNRGVVYMILSTVLFGFNVVIGKASIIESNSLFFSWFYTLCMSFGTLVFVKPSQTIKKENYKHWEIPLLGLFFAIGDILYNLALLLTLSPYVASAERLSLLVVIFYGRVFLKEETRGIVLPAFLMMVGNLLMAFG